MTVEEMTGKECLKVLEMTGFGRLGCVHENQPYVVPIYFAAQVDLVYAFSMPGRKIDWMRGNPRICLEVDTIDSATDWTSVIVLGRYEELLDTPNREDERMLAQRLLQSRPMWWEPGSLAVQGEPVRPASVVPVVFRIVIEHLTGRRCVPATEE